MTAVIRSNRVYRICLDADTAFTDALCGTCVASYHLSRSLGRIDSITETGDAESDACDRCGCPSSGYAIGLIAAIETRMPLPHPVD